MKKAQRLVSEMRALQARISRYTKGKDPYRGTFGAELGYAPTGDCIRGTGRAVLCEAAHGYPPDGAVVCSRCMRDKCIAPLHLYWGDERDMLRDCLLRGIRPPVKLVLRNRHRWRNEQKLHRARLKLAKVLADIQEML